MGYINTKKKTPGKIKIGIVNMCKQQLRKKGILYINGKDLYSCKHSEIIDKYKDVYGYDPGLSKNSIDILRKKNLTETDYIYIITSQDLSFCKIGYSKRPEKRLKEIQTGSPEILYIYLLLRGNRMIEKKLHKKYKEFLKSGEWFKFKDTSIYDDINKYKKNYDITLNIDTIDIDDSNNIVVRTFKKEKDNRKNSLYVYLNKNSNICKFQCSEYPFYEIEQRIINKSPKVKIELLYEEYDFDINKLDLLKNKYSEYKVLNADWYKYEGKLKNKLENK